MVDVTLFLVELIEICKINEILTYEQCFVLLIISLCHDIGHIGKSNQYHKDMNNDIYHKYKTNEIMHFKITTKILKDFKFFNQYNTIIHDTIIATNIDLHKKYCDILLIQNNLDLTQMFILLMKCADLSHVLRPFHIHKIWVDKIHIENNLPDDKKNITINFINDNCIPLYKILSKHFPRSTQYLFKINDTINMWKNT